MRPALLYAALVLAVFVAAFTGGFVYTHEPERDTLVIRYDSTTQPDETRYVSGTVVTADAGSLILRTEQGDVAIALPADTPVEDLLPAAGIFDGDTVVNVGVERTQFGLVLTGIVQVEGVARSTP